MNAASFAPSSSSSGRKAATRSQVCAAANAVFIERGFASPTMEEIAQRAGIRRSTLYTHFREKDAILAAIAEDYIHEVREVIAALPGPVPTREQVETWLAHFAQFVSEHRGPAELIVSTAHLSDAPAPALKFGAQVMAAFAVRLAAFRKAMEPGETFRQAWAEATLRELGSALNYRSHHGDVAVARERMRVAAMLFYRFVSQEP
ncbi:TetR/AcrR family transcriptional regulator [Sphingomonas bacterium]|uniref:TetR/AcrR family transcriptional regulator n=1 Tax=Sphingomonas bacterium TaxID=1895847 RepID=UPI001575F96E|nr:TetR/AcrR family transcriptional regulator [Sphingomonas bacterium]